MAQVNIHGAFNLGKMAGVYGAAKKWMSKVLK